MTVFDQAPAHVRAISPYQPGKPVSELAREMQLDEANIVKLASNENPLGMSPRAHAAALQAMQEIARYPDGNGFELKHALHQRFGVGMNQIVLGNGSNDVLEIAARSLLGPGTSAVYAQYAFAVYPLATQACGARGIAVPATEYGHDLDAMLAAITPDTRIVFIANPNNPTGTFVGGDRLYAFLRKVPQNVLVVLDEAYNEYLPLAKRYDSVAWLNEFANLLICRTFSKVYGLAGLRVGFGLTSPAVADLMNRIRQPFNVSSVALSAASAALSDDEFLQRSYALNQAGMQQLEAGFKSLGLKWIPSCGNFIAVEVGDAAAINQALLKQGVIVRPIGGYGMPTWLRVSIGSATENQHFLEALTNVLNAVKAGSAL